MHETCPWDQVVKEIAQICAKRNISQQQGCNIYIQNIKEKKMRQYE